MTTASRKRVRGMTQIELMIVVAIIGILGSITLNQWRDYTRRAKMSEVVLATTPCKQAVNENYVSLTDAPDAGKWGCEGVGKTKMAGVMQTSADGVIRIAIANMDGLVNGRYVYVIPAKADGTPMTAPDDLGRNVGQWICGSDWMPVRNAMPANCRKDTTSFASQDFN